MRTEESRVTFANHVQWVKKVLIETWHKHWQHISAVFYILTFKHGSLFQCRSSLLLACYACGKAHTRRDSSIFLLLTIYTKSFSSDGENLVGMLFWILALFNILTIFHSTLPVELFLVQTSVHINLLGLYSGLCVIRYCIPLYTLFLYLFVIITIIIYNKF